MVMWSMKASLTPNGHFRLLGSLVHFSDIYDRVTKTSLLAMDAAILEAEEDLSDEAIPHRHTAHSRGSPDLHP